MVPDTHVSRVVDARHPQPKHVRPVRGLLLLVVPTLDHLDSTAGTTTVLLPLRNRNANSHCQVIGRLGMHECLHIIRPRSRQDTGCNPQIASHRRRRHASYHRNTTAAVISRPKKQEQKKPQTDALHRSPLSGPTCSPETCSSCSPSRPARSRGLAPSCTERGRWRRPMSAGSTGTNLCAGPNLHVIHRIYMGHIAL